MNERDIAQCKIIPTNIKIMCSHTFDMFKKVFILALIVFVSSARLVHAVPPITLHIDINGVEKEIESHIRSEISLQYLHPDPAVSESTLDFYIEKAIDEITQSLQAYGYYNPQITTHRHFSSNRWVITFDIAKGPEVIIKHIYFELDGPGRHHPELTQLQKLITLKPGDALSHEDYENSKKAILNKVIFQGYLEAEYTIHRIEVSTKTSSAEIKLVLQTGNLYYFGPTSFTESKLDKRFLKRFLPYCPGDPFSAQQLLTLEDQLRRSDYFSEVNVISEPNQQTQHVPILVQLEDQKPNHYLLGVGYGTDTGARGKVGYLRRRVNSKGHRFRSEIKLSELYQKIEADYVIPGKRPQTDAIKLYSHYIEDEYNEKPVDSLEVTLSEQRDLYGWARTLGLSFIREKSVTFVNNDIRRDQLLLPFIEIKKTTSDNPTNPTLGKTRLIKIKGAHEDAGSDVSFAQVYYLEKWLHTFENQFKTLLRLELGATLPRSDDKLPLSQRFFAGGDTSLRGFGYRSLPAEIDKDGLRQPVGGSYLAIGSIELSKTIYKQLGVHIFADAGNAFRSSSDNIQLGLGTGISYNTPFGPIKLSVAKPMTNAANSWRIHASFGPEI